MNFGIAVIGCCDVPVALLACQAPARRPVVLPDRPCQIRPCTLSSHAVSRARGQPSLSCTGERKRALLTRHLARIHALASPNVHSISSLQQQAGGFLRRGGQYRRLRGGSKEEQERVKRGERARCHAGKDGSTEGENTEKADVANSVLRFLCPLLKLFSGSDPAAPRNQALETVTSNLASLSRFQWGSVVRQDLVSTRTGGGVGGEEATGSRAEVSKLPLQLYEFEACPFCRRVREALTELDLSAEIYPCPKGSIRHRSFVKTVGNKEMFPFLIDQNTGINMYESADIVKYLFKEYGNGADPSPWLLESTLITGFVPTLLRAGRGMARYAGATADPPPKLLELYSYENDGSSRLVREALCELELPYLLRNVGQGSASLASLQELSGGAGTQVPLLVDTNTGTTVGSDSQKMIAYLFQTYGRT